MRLYGLKNCDTCKRALKALDSDGQPIEFIDIRAEADLTNRVPVWLDGVDPARLINTRSTTWRQLDEGQRARADSDPAGLLIDNPTLIKRPVIETGNSVYVGWTKDVQAALGV